MASCKAHDGNNIESMKHNGGIIKNTCLTLSSRHNGIVT